MQIADNDLRRLLNKVHAQQNELTRCYTTIRKQHRQLEKVG